ncbi:hypothetical protein GL218_07131 [Daldinia childiae]|uniref:uncharacterized protein n=1 Tax=Daldinia childiae TaxID=326645 RepID=UPI00144697B9|nr:uncharacterized protein GL218_07131 [Daldinia childiae]KAF3055673.1 hypothetical protein GL218_07131 [Daldinia childiae]
MKSFNFILTTGLLLFRRCLVYAEPFNFPLPNGFPFPDESALEQLFTTAGGNFTNMPLATKFDADSLTSWKLQAFNEFMEVAFFTQLISNITNHVPGYELDVENQSYILDTLNTIQAQEEMHAYNANDAVRNFANGSHIFPCTYVFPVSDFSSAIAFAETFTDLYIGLLTDIQMRTARSLGTDSYPIVYVLAQALGQEGQQSGWFRSLQGKHPSSQPFLTSSTRELVFSWLQRVIVPGSCPNMEDIPLQIYPTLDVKDKVVGTGPVTLLVPGVVDPASQRVVFINGALVPTVVPFNVTSISECGMIKGYSTDARGCDKDVITSIVAEFPYAHNVMHGMTIATIVKEELAFVNAEGVTNATIYGPAIIQVN